MEWYNYISMITNLVLGGGWFIHYKAGKKKANAEATVAEAEGWKAQQDVYQQTIADLKESCEYIKQDRNLLREENAQLRQENAELRKTISEMQNEIMDLKRTQSRQGRQIAALTSIEKTTPKKTTRKKKA